MDRILADETIAKGKYICKLYLFKSHTFLKIVIDEMIRMLKEEFSVEKIDKSYNECCNDDLVKVSPEVERITQAIDDLCDMVSKDLVFNCKKLEKGFKEKCDEIKR